MRFVAQLFRDFFRVGNAFAGRHPIDIPWGEDLFVSEAIVMQHLTFKQIT